MDWFILIFATAQFVFLLAVLRPLEVMFPAKLSQQFFRPQWFTDFCFYWGHFLLWNGLVFWCLFAFRDSLDWLVSPEFRARVAAQPWWLQAVEVVLLSDFTIYWGHRLQHRVGFLWRFHAVHHSSEHLDWLAAAREHPLDTIYTVSLVNLPGFAFGFPLETISSFILFRGIWAVYIHSNVRLPMGPLGLILGAPELHHWHHDRARDAGNYGNLTPIMDVIFGTHYCPYYEPVCFGLRESVDRSYVGHMLQPLLPRMSREDHSPGPNPESVSQSGTSMSPSGFTTSNTT
ncbi:MAG: sterol desaturase family protein [Gemmataceae bacterium]